MKTQGQSDTLTGQRTEGHAIDEAGVDVRVKALNAATINECFIDTIVNFPEALVHVINRHDVVAPSIIDDVVGGLEGFHHEVLKRLGVAPCSWRSALTGCSANRSLVCISNV